MGALTDILAARGVHLVEKRHGFTENALPLNPWQPWLDRKLDAVKGAIIHHTAGVAWATSEGINKMHQGLISESWPYGWPGMAYTFYVHHDYEQQPDLPVVTDFDHRLRDWGPQCGGLNAETFGVALGGNFVPSKGPPSEAMVMELVRLMRGLQEFFVQEVGHSLYIKPHFFVSSTQCPGLAWDKYLAAIGCG